MKSLWKETMIVMAVALMMGSPLLAEGCASITGNASVDSACCIDPAAPRGGSTSDVYLSCVSQKVLELRLGEELSKLEADAIIEQAGASGVN